MLNIKPSTLIFGILTGYLLGVLILFFDNSQEHSSFNIAFSHFPASAGYTSSVNNIPGIENIPESSGNAWTQLWFFREQPLFLLWAIMHVLGVALCFTACAVNYDIQKKVRGIHKVNSRQLLKSIFVVLISIILIVWVSYTTAYGFDYVAYLIPLNHSQIKIYALEGLNYLTGAYSLVNMTIISSVVAENAESMNDKEFVRLRNLFNTSLFVTAIVIAYATFTSGVLYKALNNFYYILYDPSHKSDPYFPVMIIITLGLINTFLLCMFYFPNAQVFKNAEEKSPQLVILLKETATVEGMAKGSIFGINKDMLDTIKVLLALLSPLLSGLFS